MDKEWWVAFLLMGGDFSTVREFFSWVSLFSACWPSAKRPVNKNRVIFCKRAS